MGDTKIRYKDGGIREYDGYLGTPLFEKELKNYEENHPFIGLLDTKDVVPQQKSIRELRDELGLV